MDLSKDETEPPLSPMSSSFVKPSYIKSMSAEWEREIHHMAPEKREKLSFKTEQEGTRLVSLVSQTAKFIQQIEKDSDKIKQDMFKYKTKLLEYKREHEQNIEKLKLAKPNQSHIKWIRHYWRIELEVRCLEIIENRISLISSISQYRFEAKDRDSLLSLHPDVAQLWSKIKRLDQMTAVTPPSKFDDLILDTSTNEGAVLSSFLKDLSSYGIEKIPPSEIFCKKYAGQYDASEMRRSILSLVSRSYFNTVQPKFYKRMIKERHYYPLEPEYAVCADEINPISLMNDPEDMMDCIMTLKSKIFSLANTTLSADDFIPIMESVLMHCDVMNFENIIGFIRKFKKLTSEQDYYLTVIQSIVEKTD